MFRKIISSAFFLFCLSPLFAIEPPTQAELEQYQKDGSLAWRIQNAKALGNHLVSPDLIENLKYRLNRYSLEMEGKSQEEISRLLTLPSGRVGMPTKGTVKVLTLLIAFSDYPPSQSSSSITDKLFDDGTADIAYPYESLRNFYRRSSYNQLEIQGSVLGWYTTSYARSSVNQTTTGREALIMEALGYYDLLGHDFTQYDNDGNGTIDYLIVIWTGPDNGWGNFWWGYQTSFSDISYSLDGKRLSKYSWQWESRPYPGTFNPRTVIHETGHALGLPDYYDYDSTVGPNGGVGSIDMMDASRHDHNCFSKYLLDWISPLVFNNVSRSLTLGASEITKDAALVMPEFSSSDPLSEFFMIQNRNRLANDSDGSFPNDGLLIWHVDATLNSYGNNFLYDNSYTSHKLLRLMEADGLEEIEKGYSADADDFYVAGTRFGPATLPNSQRYDGSSTGISVYDIGPSGLLMTFWLNINYLLYPPADFSLQRLENDYIFFKEYINKLTWKPNPNNHNKITKYLLFVKPKGSPDYSYQLLAELSISTLLYEHRGLKKDEFFTYQIVTVDENGVESPPAEASN
ncbi:MAG: M6 family metalloprotease domain-containing protein [Candidatus Aminicenantales bacterium]